MKKTKEKMFNRFEAVLNHCRNIPVAVFVVLSTIFNYLLGQNIARTNELYSSPSGWSENSSTWTGSARTLYFFGCTCAMKVLRSGVITSL